MEYTFNNAFNGIDPVSQEMLKICSQYIGCEGCPAKDQHPMNIGGVVMICETEKYRGV